MKAAERRNLVAHGEHFVLSSSEVPPRKQEDEFTRYFYPVADSDKPVRRRHSGATFSKRSALGGWKQSTWYPKRKPSYKKCSY